MTDTDDASLLLTKDMNENHSVLAWNDTKLTTRDCQLTPKSEDNGVENHNISAVKEFEPLTLDQYLEDYADFDAKGDFSFTGVWHSAKGLLQYLLPGNNDSVIQGKILEIGAGTGWLGITVAQRVGEACHEMLLTDRTEFWLQANLEEARKQGIPCLQVSCHAMDWSNVTQIKSIAEKKWDFIMGSDLIYSEDGLQLLAQTLAIFATSGAGKILYAHTLGRMPELDGLWEKELQANGLAWEIRANLPVMTSQHTAWEGRSTIIMDIYAQ
eukprot:scaffold16119_cov162-Amphora_coffeaeformis.AAC.4